MNEWLVYTDYTMLLSGKWKFHKLHEVPPDYLLNIHQNRNGCQDTALINYIEKNLDRIKAKKEGIPYILEEEPKIEAIVCTKRQYPTKQSARDALKKIREAPGNHKKPIRSYECSDCSAWHHTSLPIEVWKEKVNSIKGLK